MAFVLADDFRITGFSNHLPFSWPVYMGGSPTVNSLGGGIVITPNGGTLVRRMPKLKRFCIRFILHLGGGSPVASRDLMKINLNPAEMPASSPSVASNSNASFELIIRSSTMTITRRAYDANGNPVSATQSVAAVSPAFSAVNNTANLVELMIDETNESCNVTVRINNADVVSMDYTRTIGGQACDKGYGYFGIHAGSGSNMIGRMGDLAIYTPDTKTPFPLGALTFTNLLVSSTSEVVTEESVKDVPDISGLVGKALGVVTAVHATMAGSATSATLEIEQIAPDGSVYSGISQLVTAGTEPGLIQTAPAELDQEEINAMRVRYRVVR